jgi:D-alanyl-D-alanine carboxypeptidase (penicillin-binding protein 5/6)
VRLTGATGLSPASTATKAPQASSTQAKHAVLSDVDASHLHEKDADTLMSPASRQLMTLAVVFRELKRAAYQLDDQFKVASAWRRRCAVRQQSHVAPLNSTVSVEGLIRSVTVQSGNDSALSTK